MLVGTTSIENSELISELLTKVQLPHQVLNAKQHAREADIIAQAGRPGMITIATNMAGRGTDIVLGGNIEKDIQGIELDESLSQEQRQSQVAVKRTEWLTVHEQVKSLGACASLPRSDMSHAALTTNCVAVRAVRVTLALRVLLELRRPPHAHFRGRSRACHHGPSQNARRRSH